MSIKQEITSCLEKGHLNGRKSKERAHYILEGIRNMEYTISSGAHDKNDQ